MYSLVDNIFNIDGNSEIYLIQEVQDEKYELLFGDGYFGKKLENGSIVTITYIVTSGEEGNGASQFSFAGTLRGASDSIVIPENTITINTLQRSQNGADIESVDSIKYFAPRVYSSQYRAVTSRDYEAIIKSKIYPDTESVSVVGGEELDPPQFGKVLISIKPKNGTFVTDFNKEQIKNKLRQYTVSGISPEITDLKILYVEIDSSVYYNSSQVPSVTGLKENVEKSLNLYAESPNLNKFGGRFKYSKVLQVIDNTDTAITSNITKVIIRRDLKSLTNQNIEYEICYGNQFHVNSKGYNIKSTGFNIFGEADLVYFTDTPNEDLRTGVLSIVKPNTTDSGNPIVVVKSAGTIDYIKGEIITGVLNITSTVLDNDIIEIQAFPESNDIIGLKDLYISFDVSKSKINMIKDVIASGDDISGLVFTKDSYRSSYSNGELSR
jgi:hypothetical protein